MDDREVVVEKKEGRGWIFGLVLLTVVLAIADAGVWIWFGKQKQTQSLVVEPTLVPTLGATGASSTSNCDQVSPQGYCIQRMVALVDVRDTLDASGNPLTLGEEGRLLFSKGYCGFINTELMRQRELFDEVHFKRVLACESAQ